MSIFRRSRSHALAANTFELSVRRRYRRMTVISVLVILMLAGGVRYIEKKKLLEGVRLVEIEQENAALQTEMDRLKLELQMEQATRDALQKQLADLGQEADSLKSQLSFYKAQGGPQHR